MYVKNVRFADHPRAACYMRVFDNGVIQLKSYNTIVAWVDDGVLYVTGLYSATTRKHLGWFAKQFGLTYKHIRKVYDNGKPMSIDDLRAWG